MVQLIIQFLLMYEEILAQFGEQGGVIIAASAIFAAVIYIGSFIVKAVAICVMAKRRGFKNWWMGMIPYVNYHTLGKLAGPVRIFRIDVKNMGLFAAISSFVLDVGNIISIIILNSFGNGGVLGIYTYATNLIVYLSDIIFLFSYISIFLAIYGKYAPSKRLLFTLLSLIQPVAPFILIAIMNKKPYADPNDYYREQMAKRFGQAYNPYQNPYSTKENPFNEYGDKNNGNGPENPFDEY